MHSQVMSFLGSVKAQYPAMFQAATVLEFGSRIINGSPRWVFDQPDEYIGVDWQPGFGVDVVLLAHEYYKHPDGYFDVVVSTEMLEHDPHWKSSVQRMVELTRLGGAIIITCAGPDRPEHELYTSPESDYYCGISAGALRRRLLMCGRFDHLRVESRQLISNDTYLCAYNKL